jgi:hypothetical protein
MLTSSCARATSNVVPIAYCETGQKAGDNSGDFARIF